MNVNVGGIDKLVRIIVGVGLLSLLFLLKGDARLLGLIGTVCGGGIMVYLTMLKLLGNEIVMAHGPLMIAGALLLLGGFMMFSTGLLGEMMMRTYFESQDRRIYAVREILTRKQRGVAGGAR